MSREEALRYWREDHAQLLQKVPGVRRYVQNHCLPGPDGAEPPYAGLGEVWFEGLGAAQAAIQTAEWQAVIADAATFMDMERISAAWADEHIVLALEGPR
jgi:uncharacterized protein (TIGR02118 family)